MKYILLAIFVMFLGMSPALAEQVVPCSDAKTVLKNTGSKAFWYVLNEDVGNAKLLNVGGKVNLLPFYIPTNKGVGYSGKISLYKNQPTSSSTRNCYVGINWEIQLKHKTKQCVLQSVPSTCLTDRIKPGNNFKSVTVGIKNLDKD
jgi:hypothetical protein